MSKRPEDVKCENCVFFDLSSWPTGLVAGYCHGSPPSAANAGGTIQRGVTLEDWCSMFRSEWPAEVK